MIEGLLDVPIAGSHGLLLLGSVLHVFAAAAIGIFLGTIARTMAQFAFLTMMTVMAMMMLSGGMSPTESQGAMGPARDMVLPSRHYVSFVQTTVYRGANLDIVWREFATVLVMDVTRLTPSLVLFRRSVATRDEAY